MEDNNGDGINSILCEADGSATFVGTAVVVAFAFSFMRMLLSVKIGRPIGIIDAYISLNPSPFRPLPASAVDLSAVSNPEEANLDTIEAHPYVSPSTGDLVPPSTYITGVLLFSLRDARRKRGGGGVKERERSPTASVATIGSFAVSPVYASKREVRTWNNLRKGDEPNES
ncbi:hypothetical protein GGS23DRAFT_313535 [Durotheca rogersii]|uniref:uncharacterized protein n=1 Tax=Durotheca rogersii TaxID=419775 RepID=UPI00221E581F|nr:uncharacterized protein GGS23DRAFT_313535 [Durotheca rogersii]KAI5859571.1 hypothetical protein GGS23DRAFT_313535 [Durotheca rogersii]